MCENCHFTDLLPKGSAGAGGGELALNKAKPSETRIACTHMRKHTHTHTQLYQPTRQQVC